MLNASAHYTLFLLHYARASEKRLSLRHELQKVRLYLIKRRLFRRDALITAIKWNFEGTQLAGQEVKRAIVPIWLMALSYTYIKFSVISLLPTAPVVDDVDDIMAVVIFSIVIWQENMQYVSNKFLKPVVRAPLHTSHSLRHIMCH